MASKPIISQKTRPNRRRRNYWPAFLAVLGVGLAGEAVYAALTSPRFQVTHVDVRGNKDLSTAQILKVADFPLHGNLFLLRAGKSIKRIAALPRVRSAEIHRRLPNRVILRVEERTPVALLAAGSNYYLVDETGVPYSRLDRSGYQLPVLRLEPAPAFVLGKPLKDSAFEAGMKTLPLVKDALPGKATLWVDPRLNLCLNRDDFSVRLGQPDRLDRKLRLLKGLMAADPDLPQKAQYLDLSAPEDPAMMPREPAMASAASSG